MSSQSTGRSRRPRGGSRRRGGDDRSYRQNSPAKAPAKQTFWQKITAFFSPNGNPPTTATRPSSSNNNGRSERPRGDNGSSRPPEQARSSRKPESVAVTTPRLYVGNLSFEATESDLFELFNGVGKVQNAEVVTYKHNQRSKGFAFVQMLTVEEAQRAVTELHDKEFLGRKLVVSGAKSSDHQPAE
jgi:RNA recognition motif-containing protein